MKKNDMPVTVERVFRSPLKEVWAAITDVDEMRQWYFDNIPAFTPEVGFEVSFEVNSGSRIFPHRWKVTEVIPMKKISYNWKYDGYPGDSVVTFELFQQNKMTRLKLTHQVKEDFPQDIPEFRRESCVAGWRYFIQDRLTKFMEAE